MKRNNNKRSLHIPVERINILNEDIRFYDKYNVNL